MSLNFTHIKFKNQDGEPSQTFNFKPGITPATLFEVQTVATISADNKPEVSADAVAEQNPLCADFKNDILVLASGHTANFLSFNLGAKLIYQYSTEGNATVCGISWLPLVEAVLLVLSDGHFVLCAPTFNVAKAKQVLKSCTPKCSISSTFINSECIFCVTEENGLAHFVQLIDFEVISNKQRRFGELINQASQSFKLLNSVKTNSPLIATTMSGFLNFPFKSDEDIETCALDCNGNNDNLVFHPMTKARSDFKAVRIVGAFVVALDACNRLRFWDRITMIEVYELAFDDVVKIHVFEFLDIDSDENNFDDAKILLHVSTERGNELQIRHLRTKDVIYRAKTSNQALAMSTTTSSEDAIVFIDANWEKVTLTLRFIVEAQPEMRLQRLLKRGQYDVAEVFAKTYGLDVQRVYIARIQDLIDQVSDSDDKKILSEILKYCDLIADDNIIGEMCVSGALKSNIYDWVVGFLAYAEKRNITDSSTKQELDKCHYALASYRMIFGDKPPFGTNSYWLVFIAGASFPDIFDDFCRNGKINEARILWSRYPVSIREHLSSTDRLNDVINMFYEAIIKSPRIVNFVMEWMEQELIPFAFFQSLEESDFNNLLAVANIFIQFVERIAHCLEGSCPQLYPQNALHVVTTIQRSLESMKESQVTPDTQAKVLLIFALLAVDSRDPKKSMGALNLFAENLGKLVRLYQVYHCRMSYADYLAQTKESICFLILERVHAVHLVKDHVEKFAIPFMKEHNLKKDETLYAYINKVAQYGASIKAQTNPWDELCLTICETIGNAQLKCMAIIDIAKRALPPWSPQLNDSVKKMINTIGIDRALIEELRKQCYLSDLGKILLDYQIPIDKRHEVDNINLLKGIICYIFRHQDKSVTSKMEDALLMVELVRKLGIDNVPTAIDCYQLYAMRAIVETMSTDMDEITMDPLITFMDSSIKSKEIRETVAKLLVSHWEIMIAGKEYSYGKVLPRKRLIMLNAMLCVLERFLPSSDETEFGIFISASELHDEVTRTRYLEEFIKAKRSKVTISEAIDFGNLLHFTTIKSCQIFTRLHSNDTMKMMSALSQLTQPHEILNDEQFNFVVDTISLILGSLDKLAETNDKAMIVHIIKDLKSTAIHLGFSCSKNLSHTQENETFVYQLYGYLSLFDQLLEGCIKEDDQIEKNDAENSNDSSTNKKLHGKIYEISQRNGVFLLRNEGHVFETHQAINCFAKVALSILPSRNNSMTEEFNRKMVDNWADLFEFLCVQNLSLLEVMTRCFARNLACFADAQSFAAGDLPKSVMDICQKILCESTADLWLAAYLILSLDAKDIVKLLQNLRQWGINKKNSRLALNLIRLTQFILLMLDDRNFEKKINTWYISTHWQKEVGKLGISSPVTVPIEKLIPDFVRELVPPSILRQYCIDFKLDCNSILLEYGILLCRKASSESSKERCEVVLDLAGVALRSIEKDETLFDRIFEVLHTIDPYSYEVIELLVVRMEEWCREEQDRQIIKDCYTILKFLNFFKRENGFTTAELKWYQRHTKDFVPDRVPTPEPSETSLAETSIRASLTAMKEIYDQSSMVPSDLPPSSMTRLPFHIFFLKEKRMIDETVQPIVFNELTIYNVPDWIAAVTECRFFMRLSRTLLLISAISNKINETVSRDCDLEDIDLEIIRELLMDAQPSVRPSVLQGLASNFKVLPLCKTKLIVLRLGLQVTKVWQQSPDSDESIQEKLISFVHILSAALCQYTTHYILNENGLLNSTTMELSSRPIELLQHIFAVETDWSEPVDIELKMHVCKEIAQANEANVNEVHENLINIWLPGAEHPTAYSDPNATFDFGAIGPAVEDIEKEVVLSIPYMDPSISRIVHILRARDPQSIAKMLEEKLSEDVNKLPGGYSTKIRIICCLLRSLSEDQLLTYLGADYRKICVELINLLNDRLLAISNVDISRKELTKMSKIDIVRSLVSPQSPYRQTLENTYLSMCLLMDNRSNDVGLIEKVLRRLQGQNLKMLKALLQYARPLLNVESISNLPFYYSRVVDALLQDIDLVNRENSSFVRSLIFFLLSCPVEGKHHFNVVNQRLSPLNAPVLSSLVTLGATPTSTLKSSVNRSEFDIDVQWSTEIITSEE